MLLDDHVVEERLSVWQKKKVRTYVVNGRSKVSSRRSIAGALAIAKPYERIELVGGEYFETISINIPLEIVAAEGEDPRIFSRGPCLTITQDVEVYFEHVEFVSKGKSKLDSAVAIMNGKSVFFRCKMNSILIGGVARPVLEQCTITESYNGYGIQIGGAGGAEIHHCTIHTHSAACVEIDTKGVVLLENCTIRQPSNGGHAVKVHATQSGFDDKIPVENLACRKVSISKCRIYVTSEIFRPKEREWMVTEKLVGLPSCVLVSRGACPVFTYNEILEGFIGVTFESAGATVLEGNSIYNQKSCGILVLVDEKNPYPDAKQNLRISGGNVIDRCLIGIDVHCLSKVKAFSGSAQEILLSQELPSSGKAFDWIEKVHHLEKSNSFSQGDNKMDCTLYFNGRKMKLSELKDDLRTLAKMVCAGHPSHFGSGDASDERHGNNGGNPLKDILQETFKISLPLPNAAGCAAQLLNLRGTRGVDIVDTRFSGCELCAIRFGPDGYGLVEDCDFINSGATAIVVSGGAHPLIVGCKFESSKGASIFVDNFSNPLIMGNEISHNAENGIEFCNLSRGIVMGNIIFGNTLSGILVTGGSTTTIVGNFIQHGQGDGATVTGGSKPVLMMNNFLSNSKSQLMVSEYSTPFITENTFTYGAGCGIRFESCCGGTVLDNTISYNDRGIVVELDGDPYVESNKISNSKRHGVMVGNNGLGTFVSNEITQSGSCNFVVQEGGSPVVRKNVITGGHTGGIAIIAEGKGVIEHNVISDNAMGNVILLDRFTEPVIAHNTISNSSTGCGIICGREAGGEFFHNNIFKNKQCGAYVIGKANPLFSSNTITYESTGVIISDSGRGIFKQNNIHSSYGSGIIIQLGGNPFIEGNSVSKCFLSGILVSVGSSGTVSENEFSENDVGVQLGSTLGTATLEIEANLLSSTPASPTSKSNVKIGKLKPRRSFGLKKDGENINEPSQLTPTTIRQNRIFSNTTCGVLLENAAYGILEENDIELNEKYGVMADVGYSAKRVKDKLGKVLGYGSWKLPNVSLTGGSAIIRKNRIFNHKKCNISILNHAENSIVISANDVFEAPTGIYVGNDASIHSIEGNTIYRTFDGVYADSGGHGCFENNKIYDCDGVGVYVCNRGDPQFKKGNVIENCSVSGVFVDAGGRGLFSQTTMRHCVVGVVVYTCLPVSSLVQEEEFMQSRFVTSAPVFQQCDIEENALYGVLVLTVPTSFPLRRISRGGVGDASKTEGLVKTPGVSVFPQFHQNRIRNNCHFGVCHEMYDSSELQDETENLSLHEENSPKAKRSSTHSNLQNHIQRRLSTSMQCRFAARGSMQEALGTSKVFSTDEHHKERMQHQVSFVENTISNCSIGVVVGGNCHPFFLRNRIINNAFFGMFLRSQAKAMCFGCEVMDNGVAGLYVSQGSLGAFTGGTIRRNNGFCRPDGNPHDPRSFGTLSFMQSTLAVLSVPNTSSRPPHGAFSSILRGLESYANIAAEGLLILCELVAASSVGLSLASGMCPIVSGESGMSYGSGLQMDKYDRGWAADGGMGVWLVQGSMMEISDSLIDTNRNVGVFYSRNLQQHYMNLSQFPVKPAGGFPRFPGGEVISGETRSPRKGAMRWVFFTANAIHDEGYLMQMSTSVFGEGSFTESWRVFTPPQTPRMSKQTKAPVYEGDRPYMLNRPALVSGNRIVKNGYGVVIHLHHVMRANFSGEKDTAAKETTEIPEPSHGRRANAAKKHGRRSNNKAADNDLSRNREGKTLRVSRLKKQDEEENNSSHEPTTEKPVHPMISMNAFSKEDISINIEENHVYENCGVGIVCLHIVEAVCGTHVKSRLELDGAAAEYNDVCVKVTLKRMLKQPKLKFSLVPYERMTRYAKISSNEVYKNVAEQIEVTSRYVAISQNCVRTLLQIDTLRQPSASMSSSQALLRIPLFASLLSAAPPGRFVIESNRFRDSTKGVHVFGFVGGNSLLLRNNAFVNMRGTAILIQGHLASATIGGGNVFEANDVAIRVVLPEDSLTKEDVAWMQAMGVNTRIHSNHFCAPKQLSVILEGGGAPSPVFEGNKFTVHMRGSVAFFISGPNAHTQLKRNVFLENYVPVIITNEAGTSDEGTSVILEGNRFARNFIGLLVAGGAAPKLLRNVFEENYRTGLEIIDENTRPTVQHCFFVSNKFSEVQPFNEEVMLFPEHGKICVDTSLEGTIFDFVATIVPDNTAASDAKMRLPSGLLISGRGERSVIHECLFQDNDIGVDVVRSAALPGAMKTSSCGIQLTSCLFSLNKVAGVWIRGEGDPNGKRALPSFNMSGSEIEHDATVFDSCFFVNNTTDAEGKGDVVALDGGFAIVRGSLFTGSVHGKKDGMALFERNLFYAEDTDAAVYLHKSARIRLVGNTIRGHKNGIVTYPAAWGHVEKNWILDTTRSVSAAPFCHTFFVRNRIVKAKDCGILAYGGVFTENEVCFAPTGVIVQNPVEYKNYSEIPKAEKTAFDALISENRVHSCEVEGILVAGGARIEGNCVSNCKTNMNIICPQNAGGGSGIAVVSKNALYDGEVGLLIAKGSESVIRVNDIFDNSTLGVWVKAGALGTLQGNAISSSLRDSAFDAEPGAEMKMLQNNIRNQFSPSYHKTLPTHREKERQKAAETMTEEIRELDRTFQKIFSLCNSVEVVFQATLETLRRESPNMDGVRPLSTTTNFVRTSKFLRGYTQTQSIVEVLSLANTKEARYSAKERKSSLSAAKASRSVDRRISQSTSLVPNEQYRHVLIHVCDTDKETVESTQIGKEVEAVFTSESLSSRAMFRAALTTNPSSFHASITAQMPDVIIVVVGASKKAFDTEELAVFSVIDRLRRAPAGRRQRKKNSLLLVSTILSVEWKENIEGNASSSKSVEKLTGLEFFAASNNPIYFKFSVSEAFTELIQRLKSHVFSPSTSTHDLDVSTSRNEGTVVKPARGERFLSSSLSQFGSISFSSPKLPSTRPPLRASLNVRAEK
ncbi:hypothetical protein BCY84_03121 [Trypanosoma cruzi cruzi]|nr:hypothetical protein BCY84_03121 [Trypanosoma cruzi cruzi]